MKNFLFFITLFSISSCSTPKYTNGDKYYLTEVYFENKTIMWNDSIYPVDYDKYFYYTVLYDSFEMEYKLIRVNEIYYMPLLKSKK